MAGVAWFIKISEFGVHERAAWTVLRTGWFVHAGSRWGGPLRPSPPFTGTLFRRKKCLKSCFRRVALGSVSLLRSQTKVPSNDNCEILLEHRIEEYDVVCLGLGWLLLWMLLSSGLRFN